ncbi:MAG TPA: HAD family hydrolase [Polyangiaceae bacterium]|nr:HAD family hydrolase [Polyangiaceae bacterium]
MTQAEETTTVRRGRSAPGTVPCATCATPTDPLRAARVAIFGERFRYFCSEACRTRFDPEKLATPLPRSLPPPPRPTPPPPPPSTPPPDRATPFAEVADEEEAPEAAVESVEAVGARLSPPPALAEGVGSRIGTVLLVLSAVGGSLAIALALAGGSRAALTARLVLCAVSAAALVTESWMGARDETEPRLPTLLAAPLGALLVASVAYATRHDHVGVAITLAALIVATTAAALVFVRRGRRPSDLERAAMYAELDQPTHRIHGEDVLEARASDLRPGEEIVLEAGETLPVDATITAGAGLVLPWLGATARVERREGDVLVAGARLLEGRLRLVVNWAGHDRAWARLSLDPLRRADLHTALARSGRLIAERVAPFGSAAALLSGLAAELEPLDLSLLVVAVHAALTHPALVMLPGLSVARAIHDGLRRGVAFQSAEAFDRAGKVTMLTFCARGTLLLGEPEVATIETFAGQTPEQVLALVAGVESGAQHALATSVLRAARARNIRPDGVRSPTVLPGLGTTAVASNGQTLIVGSRGLMLREHVSVAAAERRITELEAMGRTVLLVALGGRLIGILGFQDGLRPGARAAVQHVLDVGVEPVLLSGDARETCEALGRALAVEHVRPEVPPPERGDEIRRLSDGGAVTAVVGHSPADDSALSAADVSIALSSAGSTSSEWSVQLASDDVRDAAYAIRLAHDTRREARVSLWLCLVPGAIASLLATLGLASPVLGPIAAAFGGAFAVLRLRGQQQ